MFSERPAGYCLVFGGTVTCFDSGYVSCYYGFAFARKDALYAIHHLVMVDAQHRDSGA